MKIIKRLFPDRFLIVSNTNYFFGDKKDQEDPFKIFCSFYCQDIAEIQFTFAGAMGFRFLNSGYLKSIEQLKTTGSDTIPDEVMQNEDEIHILQEKRMLFVNFIVASFFGRICGKTHCALSGALYTGQNSIRDFRVIGNLIQYPISNRTMDFDKIIAEKLSGDRNDSVFLKKDSIIDAIKFSQNCFIRQGEFEYLDIQTAMVMNYQAAILHNQQHWAASLALNFSIIETLIKEIFFAYGVINGAKIKSFIKNEYNIASISKTTFRKMKIFELIEVLHNSKLFGDYESDRLQKLRKKRNRLMHKGERVSPPESGDAQTLVRDLWAHLIDAPFELNAGWVYIR